MTWYEGVLLGFLQGATEFLPVSSSGHLVMGQTLLGLQVPGMAFEVALHFATLLSVVLVYRARIGALLTGVARRDRTQMRYLGLLALASVPAAIAGIGFGDFFASLFDSPGVTGMALLVTGCVVWTARSALARRPTGKPGTGAALVMGLAQAAAIVPGISRSGATVVAALWRGVDPREAAAFSFLMSVPAVGGAALLKVPELVAG
ncbi:MAG: undecaprenyl-diphosphate phosphatase, partial [Gemmatimonadetes bacterium]|nr:undecaprenyl-diphosphate phosphatase [Gemmatimonadota bacterium]